MSCPLIGISVNFDYERGRFWLPESYCRRVAAAGAVPVLLPPAGEERAGPLVARLDGLILSGGGDIAPFFFGAEPRPGLGEVDPGRDAWEIALTREALRRDLPLLGICRGMQLLNVALGGGIVQHLCSGGYLQHEQQAPRACASHTVRIMASTRLAALAGEGAEIVAVNSFHHQAVDSPAPGLRIAAVASDGVIEAMESAAHRFVLAVQWHPESLDHPLSEALFQALVRAVSLE